VKGLVLPQTAGAIMTDNPDAHPKVSTTLRLADTPHAPFIFYENAPLFGFTNGIVNVTLSAFHTWSGPNGIVNEQVAVAHLRGNVQAAMSLRNAIEQALLLAAPTPGKAS
jgi:hypothetical protein